MKTPYELESLGWKITQIDNFIGRNSHNYNIFHAFYFPYGSEMKNCGIPDVLSFIDNFIKEEQHKEEIERFNLDR